MIDNHFVVVTPAYNVAPYIEKCIMSVLNQTYRNFEYIVIDDRCSDGTTERIDRLQKEHGGFKVKKNPMRIESPLANFVQGIQLSPGDREDIIITVDGDDWLADNTVLEYLNEVYQDSEIWMTYGDFISTSGKIKGMCKQLKNTRNYRRFDKWVTSHLRTIKRKLWDKIDYNDLLDRSGKFYVYFPDIAYMFPAIEMAGLKHSKFIDKILYIYNDGSPLCSADNWENKDERRHINAISKEIRKKHVYAELKTL